MSDIYNAITNTEGGLEKKSQFNKQEWLQQKKEEKEQAYSRIAQQAQIVGKDGGKLLEYLNLQSRLELYSVANCLLIAASNPDSTQLKDFNGWKKAGYPVKKQQKGISILEPGERYRKKDNSMGVHYNVKKVFDIGQTQGAKQVNPFIQRDTRSLLRALIDKSPVPIRVVEEFTPSNQPAFYDSVNKEVLLRKGIDNENILLGALARELSHAALDKGNEYYRDTEAFPAEMAAYMLCKRYGMEEVCQQFDFSRAPKVFQKAEPAKVRSILNEARSAMCELNARVAQQLFPNKEKPTLDVER